MLPCFAPRERSLWKFEVGILEIARFPEPTVSLLLNTKTCPNDNINRLNLFTKLVYKHVEHLLKIMNHIRQLLYWFIYNLQFYNQMMIQIIKTKRVSNGFNTIIYIQTINTWKYTSRVSLCIKIVYCSNKYNYHV